MKVVYYWNGSLELLRVENGKASIYFFIDTKVESKSFHD